MSKELERKVAGVSGRGEVVVITFQDNVVDGSVGHVNRYVVRQGALTIGEYVSPVQANTVAKALVAG